MLNHLNILELSNVLAGPAVGMFFSELGANVVKIENKIAGGDITRKWKLANEKYEAPSAYFCSVNYGKKHKFLDFNNQKDMVFNTGILYQLEENVYANLQYNIWGVDYDSELNQDYNFNRIFFVLSVKL